MADKEPNWDALAKRNAEDTRVANEEAFFAAGRKQAAEAEAAKREAERNSPEAVAKREKDKADQEEKDRAGMAYAGQVRQAQQKEIESKRLKDGGFTPDYAKKVSLGSGSAGITAAGGFDYTPRLGVGASVEQMKAVADMSNAMQAHRRAVKEYERREREKKKNDGGLSAARQSVTTRGYFPDRPLFKIGATVYNPMTFEGFLGAHPVTGVHRSAEQGWCQNDPSGAMTPSLSRTIIQAGRKQRGSYVGGGG